MSRKAATLKKTEQPSPRPQPSQPRLRLVSPRTIPAAPRARVDVPRPRKNLQQDPLEQPTRSHCGLCGNKIEDRPVTEDRTSGLNMKAQTWFYHEVCWKQLERMRRLDHSSWQSCKAINPEIRYRTSDLELDGFARSEPLSLITG